MVKNSHASACALCCTKETRNPRSASNARGGFGSADVGSVAAQRSEVAPRSWKQLFTEPGLRASDNAASGCGTRSRSGNPLTAARYEFAYEPVRSTRGSCPGKYATPSIAARLREPACDGSKQRSGCSGQRSGCSQWQGIGAARGCASSAESQSTSWSCGAALCLLSRSYLAASHTSRFSVPTAGSSGRRSWSDTLESCWRSRRDVGAVLLLVGVHAALFIVALWGLS